MSETEYVELAFYSGWLCALGKSLTHDELVQMSEQLKPRIAVLVESYVQHMDLVPWVDEAEDNQ